MVRVVGLDSTYDDRELAPYLLHPGTRDGAWTAVVELPDRLRSSYQLCPVREFRVPRSGLEDDGWAALLATGGPDPNREYQFGPCTFGNQAPASIVELPGALPQPWWQRRAEVPQGTVQHRSTGRDWPSTVDIYTPPGENARADLPVVVLLDGQVWTAIDAAATFDNLIVDGVVPPFLAVMLGSAFGPTRVRGLTRPAIHLEYLRHELMPELVDDFGATRDPARTVLVGQSLGGLAAVHAGLRAPERFGVVVSQSGSFWWPGEAEDELGGDDVIAMVAAEPPGPVRFWLEAGHLELGLAPGNRKLHAALGATGHTVTYREYEGGHDYACWRGGLGDGIAAALAG